MLPHPASELVLYVVCVNPVSADSIAGARTCVNGVNLEICKFSHTTKQLLVVEHWHPVLVGHWPVPTVPARHNELHLLRPVAMFPSHYSSNSLTLTMAGVIQSSEPEQMTYLLFTVCDWLSCPTNGAYARPDQLLSIQPSQPVINMPTVLAHVHMYPYPTALAPHTLCTVQHNILLDFMVQNDYGFRGCMMNILIRL